MILTALMQLAEREGLVAKAGEALSLSAHPDYQPLPVRWLVKLAPDGRTLGRFDDTLQKPADGKGKATAARHYVPFRSNRTVNYLAEFLVDKPEYVFGWVSPDDLNGADEKKAAKLRERAAKRHDLYVREVALAREATGDPGLAALAAFLAGPPPELPPDLGSGDLIAFMLENATDAPELISSRPKVVEYWAARRRQPECGTGKPGGGAAGGVTGVCLVTGQGCVGVELHPKPKGIPPLADTKGGVPLTSVNADAFDSYNLRAVGCAVVSREAASAYGKALNRLLADGYPDPRTGQPMSNRKAPLADDTVVVFWSKGDSNLVDVFSDAVGAGDPATVEALFKSAWKGSPIDMTSPDEFYALTLSGAIGRGTVRGWHETTLGAALRNLRQYFLDLEVVRPPDDEKRPRPLVTSKRNEGLLNQLAAQGKLENVPSGLAADLFAAVLAGRPFPRAVLDTAVRRTRADRSVPPDRAALLKAYLLRTGHLPPARPRPPSPPTPQELFVMLNEDFAEPGYRLGRLFAVLEKLQDDAIGASAGIRDRFYGAASATPVVVFPQLLRKAPHHLSKLGGGQEAYYERLIQAVCDGLAPPAPFPRVLTLEQQGLFAVGYYHQRQALFTKRDKAGPDTPTPTQE